MKHRECICEDGYVDDQCPVCNKGKKYWEKSKEAKLHQRRLERKLTKHVKETDW